MSESDPRRALEKYRRHAAGYHASARRTQGIRERCVEGITVQPVMLGTNYLARARARIRS